MKKEDKKIFKELYKPFPLDRVKFRVGATTKNKDKCIPLAYVDARDVIQRLNNVFGMRWQSEQTAMGGCTLSLPFGETTVSRTDDAGETKVEAEKGKYSGAFKRSAVHFGVGLYLYYFPNIYVDFNGYNIAMENNNFLVGGREESPFLEWMDPDNWDKYADIFLEDRVEELIPMELEYRKRFRYTKKRDSANETVNASNTVSEASPSGHFGGNTGSGDDEYENFIFTFGKYKGKHLCSLEDSNYLEFLLKNCTNDYQIVLYKRRLKELGK